MRQISLVSSSETGPQSVVDEIKAGVANALMGMKLPGAFSFNVPEYGATVNAKPTASPKNGKIMYNLSGSFVIGGETWGLRGNIVPNRSTTLPLAIGGQDLKDYQAARATLEKERQAKRVATGTKGDTDEELSAGESV